MLVKFRSEINGAMPCRCWRRCVRLFRVQRCGTFHRCLTTQMTFNVYLDKLPFGPADFNLFFLALIFLQRWIRVRIEVERSSCLTRTKLTDEKFDWEKEPQRKEHEDISMYILEVLQPPDKISTHRATNSPYQNIRNNDAWQISTIQTHIKVLKLNPFKGFNHLLANNFGTVINRNLTWEKLCLRRENKKLYRGKLTS